jgi:basic membrane protein A
VVFAAAGGTGMGVLQAANASGKFSIGVDSDQNYLYPTSVLTSMVKRVDNAVYDSFKQASKGTWKPGVQVLGLKENGIMWAQDSKLITPEMTKRINAASKAIVAGKIKVVDYRTNNSCPIE